MSPPTQVGGLEEIAAELAYRADEIRSAADVLLAAGQLVGRPGMTAEGASYELARAVLGGVAASSAPLRAGRTPEGPRSHHRPAQGEAPAVLASPAPDRRLWDRTPLLVVQAATMHSFGRTGLCAVGIDPAGHKHVLGWHWGATSSQKGASDAFVEDLFGRGVSAPLDHHLLWVTDGGAALDQALGRRWPDAHRALCARSFTERVVAHLAHTAAEAQTRQELDRALLKDSPDEMRRSLERLGQSLALAYPGATQAVHQGLSGILVVASLDPSSVLRRSLGTLAALRTAVTEAVRLGREEDPGTEDPLALGVEQWEHRTRRLIGHGALGALAVALRSPSRAA